jgi:hypothetical protein
VLPLDTAVGASSALMIAGYGALTFWTMRAAKRTSGVARRTTVG